MIQCCILDLIIGSWHAGLLSWTVSMFQQDFSANIFDMRRLKIGIGPVSSVFSDVISIPEIISLQDDCPPHNAHSYAALLPSARDHVILTLSSR